MKDKDLDELFAQARIAPSVTPSSGLMTRVLSDAAAELPRRSETMQILRPSVGFWTGFMHAIGGRAAFASLGLAALFGLVMGYMLPEELLSPFAPAYAGELELIPVAEPFFEDVSE